MPFSAGNSLIFSKLFSSYGTVQFQLAGEVQKRSWTVVCMTKLQESGTRRWRSDHILLFISESPLPIVQTSDYELSMVQITCYAEQTLHLMVQSINYILFKLSISKKQRKNSYKHGRERDKHGVKLNTEHGHVLNEIWKISTKNITKHINLFS